jgi:hypothetical protein
MFPESAHKLRRRIKQQAASRKQQAASSRSSSGPARNNEWKAVDVQNAFAPPL